MSTVTRLPLPSPEPAAEPAINFAVAESGFDLRRVIGVLKRRKVMILGVMVLFTSLSALYVSQVTPLYKAETRIVIEKNRQRIAPIESVVQGISDDYLTNETEAAVIGSRELAAKAIDRLNLLGSPLFNPALRPEQPSLMHTVVAPVTDFIGAHLVDPVKNLLFGDSAKTTEDGLAEAASPDQQRHELVERVIDAYLSGLTVVASDRSRVIAIDYTSADPNMAALGANTTAELYILDQLSTKGTATTRASEWLSQRVAELNRRVIESENKLEDYRRKSGIVDVGGSTIYQQQLARINQDLISARGQLAQIQARYQQLQANIRAGTLDTAAAVLDSPLIQSLRQQESLVARKLAEMHTQYRENHPKVKLAESELADLRAKIKSEAQKIAANLDNELIITRSQVRNLEGQAAEIQRTLEKQNMDDGTMRSLESEVKANKQLYDTLLSRLKETNVQDDSTVQQPDARIISRASVPDEPFYPKKRLMILASLVVSAALGIGLALLIELLDRGFRSLHQFESITGLPTLGLVPALRDAERSGKRPHEVAVERPNSGYGEAIRTIRTGLLLTRIDHPPRSVMVTSSVPGEGKSSIALSLACSTARSAQKAIIIDCDLRHSSLHTYLGYPNKTGLTDYLAGQAALEDVVEIDPRSGVHFITAGSRAPNPVDLLGSVEMKKLIARLSGVYDLVVLDSPPLLPVSDGLVLARSVDKAIFLTRWEKTKRETALSGLKQLLDAGADLAGVVLTQVDVRRHSQYDYADSGYYYSSSYKNYYVE